MKERVVNIQQAKMLRSLGYDEGCERLHGLLDGYNGEHRHDNYNRMNAPDQFSAPTVSQALRWVRKMYGIFHTVYVRHMNDGVLGFSVSHSFLRMNFPKIKSKTPDKLIDLLVVDISNGKHDKKDGVIDDYDEAESEALTDALKWLLENKTKMLSARLTTGK